MTSRDAATDGRPHRPSMRERQKEQTHRLLRDAALEVFAVKGYGASTIDDITTAAGASRATFYLHYDGKARIVAELYDEVVLPQTFEVYGRLDALDDPSDAELRTWLSDALTFFERNRDVLRAADEAALVDPGLRRLLPAGVLERCAQSMPRYLSRWQGRARDEALFRLELLIVELTQFGKMWVSGYWSVDRAVALDVLVDLWRRQLHLGPDDGRRGS